MKIPGIADTSWTQQVATDLRAEYPGKPVIIIPQREVIVELEPGLAIAVIQQSQSHFHLETREHYRLIKGKGVLVVAGEAKPFWKKNEWIEIIPRQVHSAVSTAMGEPAWFEVRSDPPWTGADHIRVG